MRFRFHLLVYSAPLFAIGCVGTQSEIETQRRAFIASPDLPAYGYDGRPLASGHAFLFLKDHDKKFGEFLVAFTTTTKDAQFVVAALTYFHFTNPNQAKYDEVIALVKAPLLTKEVRSGNTDLKYTMTLGKWIENDKKVANQSAHPPLASGQRG